MSKTTVQFKDLGWREIKSKLAKLTGATVKAGVVGTAAEAQHNDDEMTVGELAILQEMGNSHIPARPFARPAVMDAAREFTNVARRATQSVIRGGSVLAALNSMGEWAAGKMRERILSNIAPPLAEITVKNKGHDLALVDTDVLYDSIGFIVEHGSVGELEDVLASLYTETTYEFPGGTLITARTRR